MASIEKRAGKNGTSYRITVAVGRDGEGKPIKHYRTYKPPVTWSEARAEKEASRQAMLFEEECRKGYTLDNHQTFAQYAEYVIELKRMSGVRESTLERYAEILGRVNPVIGHLKLADIRPAHLNELYMQLKKSGSRHTGGTGTSKVDLKALLKERGMTQVALAEKAGLGIGTIELAVKGVTVAASSAERIAAVLGGKPEKYFTIERNMEPLSDKTILEHHRIIHAILAQADRELLVPYNAASKANPPRPKRQEPNYFQPETIHDILDAAEQEPLKYRLFVNLLACTGARRGELAALKWEKIDLESGQTVIDGSLNYSRRRGVYLGETKTGERRRLKLPKEVISMLKEHRREQLRARLCNGDRWHETGYVFTQDNGEPTNPQTWTQWLADFSNRHGLPHINPHAFRHSAASVLIANGTDIVTVSKLLGHSSVNTTEAYYSHLIEDAKEAASDTLADVLIRRRA